jgi:hypothetical protein
MPRLTNLAHLFSADTVILDAGGDEDGIYTNWSDDGSNVLVSISPPPPGSSIEFEITIFTI